MNLVTVIFLIELFLIGGHYQKVEAWSCKSPVTKVFTKTGTDAVLQFTADLSNLNSPRQFDVKYHDDTGLCRIRYNADKTHSGSCEEGVNMTVVDTAGHVDVTLQNVQQNTYGIYWMTSAGFPSICNCLYILSKPDTPKIMLNTKPFEGTDTTLECESTSTTKPSNHSLHLIYNWTVNMESNPSDTRYSYSQYGRKLTLTNVVNEDRNKQFTCTATEDVSDGYTSSRSESFPFVVYFGPETADVSVQSPYIITEGFPSINIKCSSDCYPSCSYAWSNTTDRSMISSTGNFSVSPVTRFIAGNYSCTSTNLADDTRQSVKEIAIIVQYAPAVMIRLSENYFKEGNKLTLYCEGVGIPTQYSYKSLKQIWSNLEIPNPNKELEGTPRYSSITFEPLTFQDTGTYFCEMNNGIRDTSGVLNQMGSKKILVEARPKVLTDELKFAGAKYDAVMIKIPFYSHPKIETTTFIKYDGLNILTSASNVVEETVKTSFYGKTVLLNGSIFSLEMKNLTEKDFGNYTLTLANTLGKTEVITYVIAEGKPSSPEVFQYMSGHSAPTFVWKKNFNGGLVQRFIIQISAVGSQSWTNHTNVDEDDSSYQINSSFYMATIRGLHPGVYTARILSYNTKGKSDFVLMSGNFEVSESGDTKVSTGAIAAGSASVVVVIAAVIVVICFLRRRNGKKDKCHSKFKTGNYQQEENNHEDNEDSRANPLHVPVDVSTDNLYSQPMKTKKTSDVNEQYAEVVKQNRKGIETAENANEESPYENPTPEAANNSQRFVNKDGLIYADLALNEIPKGKKNQVTRSVDSMTEYVEVDFTKRADPLHESDEEETNPKT